MAKRKKNESPGQYEARLAAQTNRRGYSGDLISGGTPKQQRQARAAFKQTRAPSSSTLSPGQREAQFAYERQAATEALQQKMASVPAGDRRNRGAAADPALQQQITDANAAQQTSLGAQQQQAATEAQQQQAAPVTAAPRPGAPPRPAKPRPVSAVTSGRTPLPRPPSHPMLGMLARKHLKRLGY